MRAIPPEHQLLTDPSYDSMQASYMELQAQYTAARIQIYKLVAEWDKLVDSKLKQVPSKEK